MRLFHRLNLWLRAFAAALAGVVGRRGHPPQPAADAVHSRPRTSGTEDGLQNLARFSHTREIEVEEVEQEVFVREWSQTQVERSTRAAMAAEDGERLMVDRRLPNFDRRQPGNDRRAGQGHDRRAPAGKP